ncbi:winged helix-turn-helix transcriptional regulator [Planosporangium thailandense]|uniref:Winged helix-turn-helix transcriptional regulator n=1 Tax=Planosporangium thailandense TaxID=765197 RepID=A0ABX0Y8M5_9ACTN|nr:winged helix-turn-helix domain-containing protein [Planosporangium thailandense]NJC73624.1 winged helix-turn-helix transcriptional regulator [Planosporangium thailandense]
MGNRRPATEAEAKALASAVRLRILRLCLDRALTNKEIADRLGANPATTLHHVRTLVDTGFLDAEPARRGTRGSREVPYLATGKSWTVAVHDAAAPGRGEAMLGAFLAEARLVDLDQVDMTRLGLRLTEDEFRELRERIGAILDEYADRPHSPDGRAYSVFLAYYDDVSRDAPPAAS